MSLIVTLIVSVILILFSSYLFYNALENLRVKINVKEVYISSIVAAIGGVIPEIIIPIIAILTGTYGNGNLEIGIGAILGAPLIISTLIFFIVGIYVMTNRGLCSQIKLQQVNIRKDLHYFFVAYFFLLVSACIKIHNLFLNLIISGILILIYARYLTYKLKQKNFYIDKNRCNKLIISNLGFIPNKFFIMLQLLLSLLMMTYFSSTLVDVMSSVVVKYNISVFSVSVVLIPIITEMQEQLISLIWFKTHKDIMAINILLGSLMFQVTLLPILGILFTSWNSINISHLIVFGITSLAMLNIYVHSNNLKGYHLLVNGFLYLLYLTISVYIFL